MQLPSGVNSQPTWMQGQQDTLIPVSNTELMHLKHCPNMGPMSIAPQHAHCQPSPLEGIPTLLHSTFYDLNT